MTKLILHSCNSIVSKHYSLLLLLIAIFYCFKIVVQDWIIQRNTRTGAPLPIIYGTTPPGLYKSIKAKKDLGIAGATTSPVNAQQSTTCN